MSLISHAEIVHLITAYGYIFIALMVAVEGMGVPVPGETTLILSAIVAGAGHELTLVGVIGAAALGAVLGDNTGFLLGRRLGYRLLVTYGTYAGLTEGRIKLGRYLFLRKGAIVVFCARFVALLRALSGWVAGANRMPWPRFLIFNAGGGVTWAALYGGGAYSLGKSAHGVLGPVGLALAVVGAAAVIAGILFLRRNEARLTAEAERALPDPLPRWH